MKSIFGFFLLMMGLGGIILWYPKHGGDWLNLLFVILFGLGLDLVIDAKIEDKLDNK